MITTCPTCNSSKYILFIMKGPGEGSWICSKCNSIIKTEQGDLTEACTKDYADKMVGVKREDIFIGTHSPNAPGMENNFTGNTLTYKCTESPKFCWHDTKKELPEDYQGVLSFSTAYGMQVSFFNGEEWFMTADRVMKEAPIKWMILPEDPRIEEEKL